jgi:WD40 repeat protein
MNDKFRDLIVCKYENCNKYYEEPVILNCGKLICKAHVIDLLQANNIENEKFYCKMCKNQHEINKENFIIHQDLFEFLKDDSHLSDKQKEIKILFGQFEITVNNLNRIVEDPLNYLHDYITDLKRKVDLQREELKSKIDEIALDIIKKIDNLNEECKKEIINLDEKLDITKYNQDLIDFKLYPRMAHINEEKLNDILEKLNNSIEWSNYKLNFLEKRLFKNKKCEFKLPERNYQSSDFGMFIYEEENELNELMTLNGHDEHIYAIKYIDNEKLVSCSHDYSIKIWNLKNGQCLRTLKGHTNLVYTICVLSNNRLASASDDKTIKIWDLMAYACDATIDDIDHPIICMIESNDNLISGLENGLIIILNLETYELITSLNFHSGCIRCIIKLSNNHFASGSDDFTIKVWNIDNLDDVTLTSTLTGHTDIVYFLKLMPNGNLISGSKDKYIKIWDMNKLACIYRIENESGVFKFDLINDDFLIVGSFNDKFKIFDLKNQNECAKTFVVDDFQDFILLPNGNIAVSSRSKIKIYQFN